MQQSVTVKEENSNPFDKKTSSQKETQISRVFFVLDDLGNEIVRPEKEPFLRNGKPSHAWALTIHKFQGRNLQYFTKK
jgi:ATP-dependent exoDNAse (exonuclease V) alpha subunit